MRIETMFIVIVGMLIIGALELLATMNGINGVALAGAVAAITAIITATFTYLITKAKVNKPQPPPPASYEE